MSKRKLVCWFVCAPRIGHRHVIWISAPPLFGPYCHAFLVCQAYWFIDTDLMATTPVVAAMETGNDACFQCWLSLPLIMFVVSRINLKAFRLLQSSVYGEGGLVGEEKRVIKSISKRVYGYGNGFPSLMNGFFLWIKHFNIFNMLCCHIFALLQNFLYFALSINGKTWCQNIIPLSSWMEYLLCNLFSIIWNYCIISDTYLK